VHVVQSFLHVGKMLSHPGSAHSGAAQDPSAYAAVWRRKEDASQQEYLGTIQSITQLEQGLQQRIIVRAPTMEWRGSALLFLRVVTPPGAGDEEARTQTSNVLYPTCLPGSQTLGTDKACIQFSERSPVISVEMATAVGSGEDALVHKVEAGALTLPEHAHARPGVHSERTA